MTRHLGVLAAGLLAAAAFPRPALGQASRFFTVAPCRAVDTRLDPGPMSGPSLVGGSLRTFALAGACGTPATATALAVNVTVVIPSADGALRLFAAGDTAATGSVISYRAGRTRAGSAVVPSNPSGVSVFCAQAGGGTHLLVDVSGYFAPVAAAGVSTLFIASLVPQSGTVTSGSGTSTLRLSADELSAVVTLSSANLTTPETGAHIHGPADPGQSGQVLFDLDTSPRQADGSWLFTLAPVGATSVAEIVAALKAGRLYVNVHTSRYPSGEIRGHYGLSSGSQLFVPPPPPPPLPGGLPTDVEAARFLTQATWGPTTGEIARVRQIGHAAWIDEQLTRPAASHLAYLDAARAAGEEVSEQHAMEAIWTQAITGEGQLRARMAMALSEILVVSDADGKLGWDGEAVASYMDVLNRDVFGTYRQLLADVTRSAAMGLYLDMLGNDKEDPWSGRKPNENYAREILQLFSIGLYRLHPDGRLVLDANGLPIPTYGQESVTGLAYVFTGWGFGGNPLTDEAWWNPAPSFRLPMSAWPTHHSGSEKSFLGITLPSGGTAEEEMAAALDAIAAHPNVGPFLCRRLIQRLVTSNPSPGYVYRCAQSFANDGAGVRGNLGAVARTLLLDWEARSPDVRSLQGYGKEREPMMRFGALLRAFDGRATSGKLRIWYLEDPIWAIGQNPLRAPSVFNFFEPDYAPPGEVASAGLVAPELKLTDETQIVASTNYLRWHVWSTGGDPDDLVLDLGPYLSLDATTLVDRLDLLLTAGQLPVEAKSLIVPALAAISDPRHRVTSAVNLVLATPEFAIQR